jgi:hypothetical protein
MRIFLFFTAVALSCLSLFSSCKSKNTEEPKADSLTTLYYEFHDFESLSGPLVDSTKGASGKKSGILNSKVEYSFGLMKHFRELPSYKNIESINVSFKCFMDKKYPESTFVLSIDDSLSQKNIVWEGRPIVPAKMNTWDQMNINFKVNKNFIKPNYTLKLYIWNKGKDTYNFDDLSFSFVQRKL